MNNYNDERQNKRYKRKHSKKNVTPVPMMMPMTPQPMQFQNPMIVQPQPMQPRYPIAPAYPMMQPMPVPQMVPQPCVAVPVGPPRLAAIPVTRNVPVMTPINPPKDVNKKKQKKPIVIIENYYKREEESCCSIF